MPDLFQDIRYASRLLVRAPAFTFVCILALALRIGANAAIFSVVNGMLLRPLAYRDPGRLAVVWEHKLPGGKRSNTVSPGNYLHWREMNRVFEDMGAVVTFRTTMSGRGEPEEMPVQYVTSSVMPLLGVQPLLGRWFRAADEAPHVNAVFLWRWRRRNGLCRRRRFSRGRRGHEHGWRQREPPGRGARRRGASRYGNGPRRSLQSRLLLTVGCGVRAGYPVTAGDENSSERKYQNRAGPHIGS